MYHDIENFIVAKHVYNQIINVYKLKNFSAFIITYAKFDNIKVFNYIIVNEYSIKFKNIINELVIYSFSPKMNENWFIYKYLNDLNSNNVRLFIEQ